VPQKKKEKEKKRSQNTFKMLTVVGHDSSGGVQAQDPGLNPQGSARCCTIREWTPARSQFSRLSVFPDACIIIFIINKNSVVEHSPGISNKNYSSNACSMCSQAKHFPYVILFHLTATQ
jgi:hypothetical protein